MNISDHINAQRAYFNIKITKPISFRKAALIQLKKAIEKYEPDIEKALWDDLKKSKFESYITETGFVLTELNRTLKKLKNWSSPKRVKTPLFLFGSKSHIQYEPYGISLILSPWNYPFQLLFAPLIGAVAAGNCVILKPSPASPHTTAVSKKIIKEAFDPRHVILIEADNRETDLLLQQRYDYIFYTGGVEYGKRVMEAASKHLTPVTLELGGKSPCIIDKDANIDIAARRIVWGKFLNCGQTCVAPDYIFVHQDIKYDLILKLKDEIIRQYGKDPQKSPDYPRIIHSGRFYNLMLLLKQGKIEAGGKYDEKDLYIAPTVISGITPENRIMNEEIFGPILPVMTFNERETVIDYINSQEKPLALYYFGKNKKNIREILEKTSSGGVCINDVVTHLANPDLPFGGVGHSGIGRYHGIDSFYTFSHTKSVLSTTTHINPGIKFAPYAGKLSILKRFMK